MKKVLLSSLLALAIGGVAAAQQVAPRSIPYSMLSSPNGVATLSGGKIPASQLNFGAASGTVADGGVLATTQARANANTAAAALAQSLAAGVTKRAPLSTDDINKGYLVGDNWVIPSDPRIFTNVQNTAGFAVWEASSIAAPFPMDAIGGALPAAGCLTKLGRASYSGPLINVENPTALVPTDIGFMPDGSINAAALWAVAGSAGYVDLDGCYDQAGTPVMFSGSISGTTLIPTTAVTLPIGSVITGTNPINYGGVAPGTTIVSGSGTSYTITPSQTEATVEPMMASNLFYQTNVANMPTMTPPGTLGNSFPIIFDGHLLGTPTSKFLNIPTSVAFGTGVPVSLVVVAQAADIETDVPIVGLIDTTNSAIPLGFGNFAQAAAFGVSLGTAGSAINNTVAPSVTPFVAGAVANGASPASFTWLDAHSALGSVTRGSLALGGGYVGKYVTSTNGAFAETSEILIYGRALSTTDESTANAVNDRYFGIAPQADDCWIADGDSITQDFGTTLDQGYVQQVKPLLTHAFRIFDASIYGESSAQQLNLLTSILPTELSNCAGEPNKVLTEFTGTNNLATVQTITASQLGNVLSVTNVQAPVGIGVYEVLSGPGIPTGETITGQTGGAVDGNGTYTVSQNATVASENTINASPTAASIYYDDQQIAALAHANGYKFGLINMLPRTGFAGTNTSAGTNEDTIRLAYDALITSNAGGFEDFYVDVASEPTMGNEANLSNTALYVGGVHPTNLGDAYLAQPIATAINGLFP